MLVSGRIFRKNQWKKKLGKKLMAPKWLVSFTKKQPHSLSFSPPPARTNNQPNQTKPNQTKPNQTKQTDRQTNKQTNKQTNRQTTNQPTNQPTNQTTGPFIQKQKKPPSPFPITHTFSFHTPLGRNHSSSSSTFHLDWPRPPGTSWAPHGKGRFFRRFFLWKNTSKTNTPPMS